MNKNERIKIIDNRNLDPDGASAVPNDLIDKYVRAIGTDQMFAILDLIRQTYQAGLSIGRNESPLFTIIPMTILEDAGLSANAKLLYGEIMALAKKSGKCYATNQHLGESLGMKASSIPRLLRELSSHKLIEIELTRNKKGTFRNIRVLFFGKEGACSITSRGLVRQQGQKRNTQSRNTQKEFVSQKADFVLSEYLKKMKKDSRHIQVIAMWIEQKGLTPESEEQVRSIIKRNLRPARELAAYKDEDILATINTIQNTDWIQKWTLETVVKFIDETVAARAKSQGRPAVRFEKIVKNGEIVVRAVPT